MNLTYKIIRQSILVLIFAAVISSLGGIGLAGIEEKLTMFLPLAILVPALNNMAGNFGIIIVSRFTTYLQEKRIKKFRWDSKLLRHLFKDVFFVAILSAVYIAVLANAIGLFKGVSITLETLLKTTLITTSVTILLILILFFVAVFGGLYVYRRNQDPDNVLIPITTALADLGSLILFSLLVGLLF